jgi:hypothetical protein
LVCRRFEARLRRPTSSGIDFTGEGSDEMGHASGDGWVKPQKHGLLKGENPFPQP